MVRKIVHLRWKQRLGPVEIGDRLGMPASTVRAVLTRCRLDRLSHIDRATGEPIRRYEHQHPGDLIHVNVKKLGKVPDGGGWRYVGKQQGYTNRSATARRTGTPRSKWRNPIIGTCYLHTVIDNHSRVAYVEAHDDETKETATQVLRNAVAWFAERGVSVQRVLADNGKIERFHRTLAEGWAFKSSTAPSPPDSQHCQHGSTSTTTTGPTRPSGSAHPSRG